MKQIKALMAGTVLAAGALLAASAAQARPVSMVIHCGDVTALQDWAAGRGEMVLLGGSNEKGFRFWLVVNPDTGSWTVLGAAPGRSELCAIAAGNELSFDPAGPFAAPDPAALGDAL